MHQRRNKPVPEGKGLVFSESARRALCSTAITQLVTHPYASAEGLTAQEREPDGKAAAELGEVWKWLVKQRMV